MTAETGEGAGELLALWERALEARSRRDDALLGAFYAPVPSSLGARNAALLSIRARLFGRTLELCAACPSCASVAEFNVDCTALAPSLLPADGADAVQQLELDGYRVEFRVPDANDVRAATAGGEAEFLPNLLARCVLGCERAGSACPPESWPPELANAVSQRMEQLEPGASVRFELTCPECGERWPAGLDAGQELFRELEARAERLLLDVDALARAYGWSEGEVLALSPTRRAAYLQLVGAA